MPSIISIVTVHRTAGSSLCIETVTVRVRAVERTARRVHGICVAVAIVIDTVITDFRSTGIYCFNSIVAVHCCAAVRVWVKPVTITINA
jgi:hypothetical protein